MSYTKTEVEANTIFRLIVGSKLYGTDTPDSDQDEKGVCVMSKENYLGFMKEFQQMNYSEQDVEIYDISKFFTLAAKNNPNILDMLFAPRKYWLKTSDIWERVYENRYLFLSKKVKHSFLGYANAQLKRIETHKKWLLNPPDHQPTRQEFGITERPAPKEYMSAILSIPSEYLNEGLRDNVVKEKNYQKALDSYNSYETWKRERNPARAALEAKINYDAKSATHLYRLMLQGKEVLETGDVRPDRRGIDADVLREIRFCKWPYEKLMEKVAEIESQMNDLYEKSTLRYEPDIHAIQQLHVDILRDYVYNY